MPTFDPTADPTIDPTIGTTALVVDGPVVVAAYSMTIDADFAETQASLEAKGVSLEEFGLEVIREAMHQDSTPSLGTVEIAILEIRSGSIIIEYTLSAQQQLLDVAATKSEQSVGQQLILRLGDTWASWGTLASFVAVEESTTAMPATMPPTKTPVAVVITPVSGGEETPVVSGGAQSGGGLGGGLTTPILLVLLIGCCLLCVVVAMMVNHRWRKTSDGDHHKYASGTLCVLSTFGELCPFILTMKLALKSN